MFCTLHRHFSFQKNRVGMVVAWCPEFHVHALPGIALSMGINLPLTTTLMVFGQPDEWHKQKFKTVVLKLTPAERLEACSSLSC